MKKLFVFLFSIVIILVAIVLFNTYNQPDLQPEISSDPAIAEVGEDAVKHLQESLRFKTISHHPAMLDSFAFDHFGTWMRSAYPVLFDHFEVDTVGTHTYIFKWSSAINTDVLPVCLMGHQDVVPADASTLHKWHHPPFEGVIDSGYVYGRGTLDDKGAIVGILEAADALAQVGFEPERDIYFVFGQDEELGGHNGAALAAKHFESLGIRFDWVMDEGGIIADGLVPGIDRQVALIGVAEKGDISVDITAEFIGGHSSMPGDTSVVTLLAEVVNRLKANEFEPTLEGPMSGFLAYLGPHSDFLTHMASANLWAFEDVVMNKYQKTASGSALVRTTVAPTVIRAGIKDNVIPGRGLITCNSRIMPGSTAEDILQHYKDVLEGLPVTVSLHGENSEDPSEISDFMGDAFQYLGTAARTAYADDNMLVAPYLMVGQTDGRHMKLVCDRIYRITPFRYEQEDLSRLHGINERIRIEDYEDAIRFYIRVLQGL